MKIREIIKKEIQELNKYKIEDGMLKIKILLEYELKITPEYLNMHLEDDIDPKIVYKFNENIKKIIEGKPVQYITNRQCFFGLDFYVDESVLIPQPDTEILVEEVINIANKMDRIPKILDICTGSGAIAISIAKNVNAEITATDVSSSALEIANKNALKNNVKIKFIESNMFKNITDKFDIIVSNPPYVETEIIKSLPKEVKNEPLIALDGGEDGLNFYKILANEGKKFLLSNGILAVEIGYNQKDDVMKIFKDNGFFDIYSKKDYGGNYRIIVVKI